VGREIISKKMNFGRRNVEMINFKLTQTHYNVFVNALSNLSPDLAAAENEVYGEVSLRWGAAYEVGFIWGTSRDT